MSDAQRLLDDQTNALRDRLEPLAAELADAGQTVSHPLAEAAGMFSIAMAMALRSLDDEEVQRILDDFDASLAGLRARLEVSTEAKDAALFVRQMLEIAIRQLFESLGDVTQDQ